MKLTLKPLKDQVIVITGASSGIGLTTARMAAKLGASVVLAARNEDALNQLSEEINKYGRAISVVADVGKEEDMVRIADAAIRSFGTFDTWVNNAGVSIFGGCLDVSVEDMKRMFDTNFWGVVYGSRIAVSHYMERKVSGALINVGSSLDDRTTEMQSTYSVSKHAVHGWTNALRLEVEKEKAPVSVSLIHPGRIDTPYDEHARSYLESQPAHVGYAYAPEAVAEAILYCATHPKKDTYVGLPSKFLAVLGAVSPRLTDKIMEASLQPAQKDTSRPSRDVEGSALYKPGYGMQERGSGQGLERPSNLYVKASKHPVLSSILAAGVGAGIWLLTRKNKTGTPTH